MSPYRGFLPPSPTPTRWRVLRAAVAFGLGWALGDGLDALGSLLGVLRRRP